VLVFACLLGGGDDACPGLLGGGACLCSLRVGARLFLLGGLGGLSLKTKLGCSALVVLVLARWVVVLESHTGA